MPNRLAILLTTNAQRVILLPKSYVHEVILLPKTDVEQQTYSGLAILLTKADGHHVIFLKKFIYSRLYCYQELM